jgi:glyoxylase-like metal-dependent hydrolase (beta-lactamase superfamily II)
MAQEPSVRVISIGALSAHPLWGERGAVRTGHATTTLITTGAARILVDPGLPPTVLGARLAERANMSFRDVTHVFLTSFHPDARRGLMAFEHAKWLISEAEREAVGVAIATRLRDLIERGAHASDAAEGDDEGRPSEASAEGGEDHVHAMTRERAVLEREVALLTRCEAAPDELAPRVDLFPLPGVSPGSSGVLIEGSRATILICGDTIPTVEHLERGQVLTSAADVERARESFREAVEIADALVLGRDNIILNAMKGPF